MGGEGGGGGREKEDGTYRKSRPTLKFLLTGPPVIEAYIDESASPARTPASQAHTSTLTSLDAHRVILDSRPDWCLQNRVTGAAVVNNSLVVQQSLSFMQRNQPVQPPNTRVTSSVVSGRGRGGSW